MRSLQDGIYYAKGSRPGQSMSIIFLRGNRTSSILEIGETIERIWQTCTSLKEGILKDFTEYQISHPKSYNDLTILVGYGPKVFDLQGSFKKKPKLFDEGLRFAEARKGGSQVFTGSDLLYDEDISENHTIHDDIVIQFIASNSFITSQCVVEVWHELSEAKNEKNMSMTRFYNGFRRSDDRNWLGFHDGLSNIKSEERKDVIAINQSQVTSEDNWVIDGTFMAFIRMYVDLVKWWKVSRNEQEIMVGRDKLTGCPITGINETTKKNIVIRGCPIPGTKEVTEKGNEMFRNHPHYGSQLLPPGVSDKELKSSHVSEMGKFTKENYGQNGKNSLYKIFRQGYEFLENTEIYPGLRAGLNFISFQDNPKRLFNVLTNIHTLDANKYTTSQNMENSTKNSTKLRFNSYFKVGTAGIFFVPPKITGERFPGSNIFFSENAVKKSNAYR